MALLLGLKNYVYVALICLALGYLKGCADEKERFDEFKGGVEAIGQAQEKWSRERNEQLKAAKEDKEREYKKLLSDRQRRHDFELERMRLDVASGSLVSQPSVGAGVPVPTVECFSAAELDARIREAVSKFLKGVAGLLQRGEDAEEEYSLAAVWAKQVGACKP